MSPGEGQQIPEIGQDREAGFAAAFQSCAPAHAPARALNADHVAAVGAGERPPAKTCADLTGECMIAQNHYDGAVCGVSPTAICWPEHAEHSTVA